MVSPTVIGAVLGVALASAFVLIVLPWRPRGVERAAPAEMVRRVDPALDSCASCHQSTTPGIVEQWASSVHGMRGVTCGVCHEVSPQSPYAVAHVGSFVSPTVTPRVCGRCHERIVEEFERSRHGLASWVSLNGTADFARDTALMAQWGNTEKPPELPADFVLPVRGMLHAIEGPEVMPATCERCHEIGRPNRDGSAGSCSKCHLRHRFNLEQVRRPETCNACHVGPDQPQWEIFQESAHGVIYHTQQHFYNFEQMAGRLRVTDYPAPTCQVCHISGFGSQPTTHDVGDRLAWHLARPIATHRVRHEERREAMIGVCRQCHSTDFIARQFDSGDSVVAWTNARITEANGIVAQLMEANLIPRDPFVGPVQHLGFELWHYYGRTARFGALMQGADYTQWHGVYPLLRSLDELRAQSEALRGSAPWRQVRFGARAASEEASSGG